MAYTPATYDAQMFIDTFEHEYTWLNGFMRNVRRYGNRPALIDPSTETTWTYKGPKGYQVELFERAYYNNNGIRYTSKMLENDAEVMLALSLVGKLPDRKLTISAIKPDSERKFD